MGRDLVFALIRERVRRKQAFLALLERIDGTSGGGRCEVGLADLVGANGVRVEYQRVRRLGE
jgi:hypothetical protein